ncbi:MAG: hypothetical protein HYU02_07820 [Thaumarchaeota archaeon]|nr:hypothetical protein [Nitrososphaerota archaeon]
MIETFLYAKVQIGTKIFDPLTPTLDFNLSKCHIELSSQGQIGKITATIEDSSGALQADIACGKQIDVWLAKQLPFSTKFFLGKLEKRNILQSVPDAVEYEIEGAHITSRLTHRIVHFARIQKRLSDGVSVDNTDNTTLIENMVKDIVQKTDVYPTGEPTLETADGITVSGVESTSLRIPEYICDYKPASDALRELGDVSGRTFWLDEAKDLKFKAPQVLDSGVLITDNPDSVLAQGWDATKLATILQDDTFDLEDSIVETKNRIFGIGGDEPVIDQKQETTSGGQDALDTLYRAQKLSPKELRMAYVAVYIDKTGSPGVDLEGEIREDNSNTPQGGSLIKVFKVPLTQIGATGWYIADVGADKINTSKAVWLILYKKGSSGNTFRWYRDSSATSTRATSSDGITWSVVGSTYSYAFRTYSATRLLSIGDDEASKTAYNVRETVISDPSITERKTMENLVNNLIGVSGKLKRTFTCTIYPPDTMMLIGQSVRVVNSKLGLDDLFEITRMAFDMEEGVPAKGVEVEGVVFV